MEINQIISLLGALGIGSVLGIFIQSHLDKKNTTNKLLFETRVKAYSEIIGLIQNCFIEEDFINEKMDDNSYSKMSIKINKLLSETFLVSNKNLAEIIFEYKDLLEKLFKAKMKKEKEYIQKDLMKKTIDMSCKIIFEMRKELQVID